MYMYFCFVLIINGAYTVFQDNFLVDTEHGNHELWIRNDNKDSDSISKFHSILKMCSDLGVHTAPAKLCLEGDPETSACVWIVPLFSWYAKPEDDIEDSLYEKAGNNFKEDVKFSEQVWMDNHLCKWDNLPEGFTVSKYFSLLNQDRIKNTYDAPVITFSHFVPRLDLVRQDPSDIAEVNKHRTRHHMSEAPDFQGGVRGFNFSRYAGSKSLERDLRSVKSVVHVYGHQHRNRDRVIDDVRYVSHCMGYVREQKEGWTWGIDEWKGPKKVWPVSDLLS